MQTFMSATKVLLRAAHSIFRKAQGSNQVELSVIGGRVLTLHLEVTHTPRLRCVRKITERPSGCIDLRLG
jgi:hypothetical protein